MTLLQNENNRNVRKENYFNKCRACVSKTRLISWKQAFNGILLYSLIVHYY